MWGATTRKLSTLSNVAISIHAPRVGRDPATMADVQRAKISIHAPRVGRDRMYVHLPMRHNQFQSTRPVWGATNEETERFSPESISIHAPRVGRDYAVAQNLFGDCISIHAPRVGRDKIPARNPTRRRNFNPRAPCGARPHIANADRVKAEFQSTRPVWGATSPLKSFRWLQVISIHAPRVGRDGGGSIGGDAGWLFQSTRPVWGATEMA